MNYLRIFCFAFSALTLFAQLLTALRIALFSLRHVCVYFAVKVAFRRRTRSQIRVHSHSFDDDKRRNIQLYANRGNKMQRINNFMRAHTNFSSKRKRNGARGLVASLHSQSSCLTIHSPSARRTLRCNCWYNTMQMQH